MKFAKPIKISRWHFATAIAIYLICLSAAALSRMGTATITESNGLPCFSIPKSFETRNGLPLHLINVSQQGSPERDKLPPTVWQFVANDYEKPPVLRPEQCIRYGDNPPETTQENLEPLELLRVYRVFIKAHQNGSSMMGYSGEFCLKPTESGKTIVQVISTDQRLGDSRYAGCRR